jgi:hypothetical protein
MHRTDETEELDRADIREIKSTFGRAANEARPIVERRAIAVRDSKFQKSHLEATLQPR